MLAGVFIFLRRRLRDPGALAVERSRRLPRARRPLRRVGHRTVPHRVEHVPRRAVLRDPEHPARAHGDPRADVHPVRQAVPHLPAPGQPRRRVLQASQRGRPRSRVPSVRRGVRRARSRSPTSKPCSRKSASTTRIDGGGSYQDDVPAMPARLGRARAVGTRRRLRLMARLPVTEEELDRALRPASQRGAAGRLGRGARDRPRRDDPLLLLRPAVRHQAEGARQRGRRLRAVVRVPVQRGQALPEGREALPPGQPSRPAAPSDGARPVGTRRLPADQLGRRARSRRRRDPPHPGAPTATTPSPCSRASRSRTRRAT